MFISILIFNSLCFHNFVSSVIFFITSLSYRVTVCALWVCKMRNDNILFLRILYEQLWAFHRLYSHFLCIHYYYKTILIKYKQNVSKEEHIWDFAFCEYFSDETQLTKVMDSTSQWLLMRNLCIRQGTWLMIRILNWDGSIWQTQFFRR